MKTILILLALLLAAPAFSQITVEGNVTDANAKTPILAHAHIGKNHADMDDDMAKSKSYQCSNNGHFSFKLSQPGIYSLRVSAVNHQELAIPLILRQSDKHVEINVRLQANPFEKNIDKVTVIGDWNKFAFASTDQMTPMQKEGKTIYTYERTATGDTLSYQLMGVAGEHSVNGTQADYYTYDGGGDYRSVIRTHKGEKVTIVFDPSKWNFAENPSLPTVDVKGNPILRKIVDFDQTVSRMRAEELKSMGGNQQSLSKTKLHETRDYITHFIDDAKKERDSLSMQYAAVLLTREHFPQDMLSKETAEMILETVPATSAVWVVYPYGATYMSMVVDSSLANRYFMEMEHNPTRLLRAMAFARELETAFDAKDKAKTRKYYDLVKKDYGDIRDINHTLVTCNPDAVVQVGKAVPAFEVSLLDGSGKVSNTSMLGKYYMIDFWATWCGPCVGEMPSMHAAYEKFKGKKGFEILSLSMDAAENQIAPFRAKKWKMPWLHAFIPGVFEAELAKKFEVAGIPRPVLVDPDGNIVAMEGDLRFEDLEKTLAKFLGETN